LSAARGQETGAYPRPPSMCACAYPSSSLFFMFAGHGGQVCDKEGDEDDGMDEVIETCDHEQLVDDELFDLIVRPLPQGCRLTAVFDCCNSGTALGKPS